MSSLDDHRLSVASAFSTNFSTSTEAAKTPCFRRLASSLSIRTRDSRYHRRRNASSSTVSPEECDALPSSSRRENLPPAEGMYIGHQATLITRKKQQRDDQTLDAGSPFSLANTNGDPSRSKTAPDRRYLRRRCASCTDASPSAETMISTRDEALWYRNLPDKIRRQQFSRVEQHFLGERSRTILSACGESSGSDTMASEAHIDQRRQFELVDQTDDTFISTETATRVERESIGILTMPVSPRPIVYSTWPTDRSDSATAPPILLARKTSTARTLVPIPLPPPKLAPLPTIPQSSAAERPASIPTTNFSWRRNVFEASPNHPEIPHAGDTHHYQDPETRNTLRNYLSSTHRFDEVIEFGFPVNSPPASVSSDEDYHAASVYSDDGTCPSLESHGPLTPTTLPTHYRPRYVHASSIDSGVAFQIPLHKSDGSSPVDSLDVAPREMTLRMTLTRPGVRGLSLPVVKCKQSATPQGEVARIDPLALEELTFSDDTTGAHGAFAVYQSPSHERSSRRRSGVCEGVVEIVFSSHDLCIMIPGDSGATCFPCFLQYMYHYAYD